MMIMHAEICWDGIAGFAGFAPYLTAVKGSSDPCTGAVA